MTAIMIKYLTSSSQTHPFKQPWTQTRSRHHLFTHRPKTTSSTSPSTSPQMPHQPPMSHNKRHNHRNQPSSQPRNQPNLDISTTAAKLTSSPPPAASPNSSLARSYSPASRPVAASSYAYSSLCHGRYPRNGCCRVLWLVPLLAESWIVSFGDPTQQ